MVESVVEQNTIEVPAGTPSGASEVSAAILSELSITLLAVVVLEPVSAELADYPLYNNMQKYTKK